MMILVTGGGGFIGLNLAKDLMDRGQQVLLVDRHAFEIPSFLTPLSGKQAITKQGNIGDLPFLYRLIREHDVDSIIHAASLHETTGGLYEAMKVNLQSTFDILEAAHIFGIKRVTFISSVNVYLELKQPPKTLHEDMDLPVKSLAWITATKKAGEQISQLYQNEYRLSVPIVRPGQVWGPLYRSGRSPIQAMFENAVAGKPTDLSSVYGNKKMVCVYVRDCVKAISLVHLAPSLDHPVYNISDGETHSLADFAQAVKEVIPGAEIKLGKTPSENNIDLPPMSMERIKKEVGFTPEYDLKRAARAYISWIRESQYQ